MAERFQWPEWLSLTEKVFDFSTNLDLELRTFFLHELMSQPCSPHSLDSKDRLRLSEEFKTLYLVAIEEMKAGKISSQEQLYYNICTKENLHRHSKNILAFALRFLSRTMNECIMESFFSTIKETDSAGKPFTHETIEKICFIRCNGPDPLVANSLVRAALNEHFKTTNWHFLTEGQQFYTSAAITTQVEHAKQKFSLFE
jgi:hypothetical protein